MKVLVASLYELGHQPLSSLSLAGALAERGHDPEIFDYDRADSGDVLSALHGHDALVISVPMHTASAIALGLIQSAYAQHPELPVALFGLYAANLAQAELPPTVGLLASGETTSDVLDWIDGLGKGDTKTSGGPKAVTRTREKFAVEPSTLNRSLLPPLSAYAKLSIGGVERLTGYTEASRGCMHSCSHCPVPTVYRGRIRINTPEWVLADIDQLVAMGAAHITFGDPDFFNAPVHSMRILRAMHAAHPDLTFDATIKVEHLLEHRDILPELAELGCAFVVSAFEHTSEQVLEKLRKGHTRGQMAEAVRACREVGIELRPSLLPFTPWTAPADLVGLFEFVHDQQLIGNVDPIQFTIRLLVPAGSLLLEDPQARELFARSKGDPLSYAWESPWPELDALQRELADRLPGWLEFLETWEIFDKMYRLVCSRLGFVAKEFDYSMERARTVPKLTESWFCCAEPAETMIIAPVHLSRRPAAL
ncbi:MAG: radical SAM protein [Actinomycetota bacterium]|nr:radical SAM protein [Actinomycetota bacterium]